MLTIVLALATKDVVLSLFLGILSGTLIASGGNLFAAVMLFSDKLVTNLGDGWNMRIFLFLALLGALVGLMAKTGASRAFGDWASAHVKTRKGTLLATWAFGVLVFIDDYFNSLAIGTAMRPVSDRMKISRAKLAYILDSTAAPVCILAPVSTWVVTVMSYMRGAEGFDKLGVSELSLFVRTIPYNLYAIFAILMVLAITLTKRDFGPMLTAELRAHNEGQAVRHRHLRGGGGRHGTGARRGRRRPQDQRAAAGHGAAHAAAGGDGGGGVPRGDVVGGGGLRGRAGDVPGGHAGDSPADRRSWIRMPPRR